MNDELDIEAASQSLASDILGTEPAPESVDEAIDAAQPEAEETPEAEQPAEVVQEAIAPPKSWKTEMHPHWGKLDPEVQKYYLEREKQMLEGLDGYKSDAEFAKTIRSVTQPYSQMLAAQGLDEAKAVHYLLNAHAQMSAGTPEQRAQFFQKMAERYQVDLGALRPAQPAADLPPEVRPALERLEGAMTAKEQAELSQKRESTAKEVEAFASDPAHPYFDELADDIVAMLKVGHTLKDAYEKAVWANPATRQKEMTRIQAENQKAIREKEKQEVQKAKKATAANVRGRETNRAPTAPVGSMDDVLSETLREIQSRAA